MEKSENPLFTSNNNIAPKVHKTAYKLNFDEANNSYLVVC